MKPKQRNYMKTTLWAFSLCFISSAAFAAPTFEKSVDGNASVWNLAQAGGGINTTLYISGDAAKEIYENLAVKVIELRDESGHPTGNGMKAAGKFVCTSEYGLNFRCAINFDGKTGKFQN